MDLNRSLFGELDVPKNDSWLRMLLDVFCCVLIFVAATAATKLTSNLPVFKSTRSPLLYGTIWLLFMLLIPVYSRWRGRCRFENRDILWSAPVFVSILVSMEYLGTTIWTPISGCVAYVIMTRIRFRIESATIIRDL